MTPDARPSFVLQDVERADFLAITAPTQPQGVRAAPGQGHAHQPEPRGKSYAAAHRRRPDDLALFVRCAEFIWQTANSVLSSDVAYQSEGTAHALSDFPQRPDLRTVHADDLRPLPGPRQRSATDLAKSDEMPDWLPVSQLLEGQGTASAFTPPAPATYTDPAFPAAVNPAFANSSYAPPPNLHWGLRGPVHGAVLLPLHAHLEPGRYGVAQARAAGYEGAQLLHWRLRPDGCELGLRYRDVWIHCCALQILPSA